MNMKLVKGFKSVITLIAALMIASLVMAADPVITPQQAASYAGKNVIVEGKVLRVGQSKSGTVYFLNFSTEKNAFTTVIFAKVASQIKDIKSYEGKTVRVAGKMENDPKYGIQIILSDPSKLTLVTGAKAAAAAPAAKAPAAAAPSKPVPVADVAKYVDQVATVEGKVVSVGQSTKSNTYFLNFSPQKNVFTVVIFSKVADQFKANKTDIKSFEGKNVRVTGKIVKQPQYGIEILLDRPANIQLVK
jgi:DNA/RNA endonuclease YhcR with UshA esterase domain